MAYPGLVNRESQDGCDRQYRLVYGVGEELSNRSVRWTMGLVLALSGLPVEEADAKVHHQIAHLGGIDRLRLFRFPLTTLS
jgi:hypothetical protein